MRPVQVAGTSTFTGYGWQGCCAGGAASLTHGTTHLRALAWFAAPPCCVCLLWVVECCFERTASTQRKAMGANAGSNPALRRPFKPSSGFPAGPPVPLVAPEGPLQGFNFSKRRATCKGCVTLCCGICNFWIEVAESDQTAGRLAKNLVWGSSPASGQQPLASPFTCIHTTYLIVSATSLAEAATSHVGGAR